MRISDWSSDVCSSDLAAGTRALIMIDAINERGGIAIWESRLVAFLATADRFPHVVVVLSCRTTFLPTSCPTLTRKRCRALPILALPGDRKSVVSGKSVAVRVDLGGSRIIKKKYTRKQKKRKKE